MESEDIGLNEYFEEMDRVESVVGGASASECTYDQGYLPRQAVYSCLDCTAPTSDVQAGFCHACRINCHKTHNVEEIYTKRNFRCDCGTLPQLLCSLKPEVDVRNEKNQYSQNSYYHPDSILKVDFYISKITKIVKKRLTHSENPKSE